MILRKLYKFIIITAVCLLAVASCKKDKETEIAPSLGGRLTFYVEPYVTPGATVKMAPDGAIHPEGKGLGYSWKITPGMDKADTTRLETGLSPDGKESDGSYTYTFPDSLGTYTVTCAAFASGYGGLYTSMYVTVVESGYDGSLTGLGISENDPCVEIDGNRYYYVSINGLDWLRHNLSNPAYGAPYANSEVMSDILGRYYSHDEAMKACPEGWRLPTDKEWREMAAAVNGGSVVDEFETIPDIAADLMTNAQFNLKDMWEYWPEVGDITNKSRLGMIPGGYANLGVLVDGKYAAAAFTGIYEYATFWTADKVADDETMAYYRYLICDEPEMYISKGDAKSFGANVRCVRISVK